MAANSTAGKAGKKQTGSDNILYIGLDLGTSQSAIATSNGVRVNTASVVGWPKDLISFKLHQKPILFGDECLRNRMSLDLFYPLERGCNLFKIISGKKIRGYRTQICSSCRIYQAYDISCRTKRETAGLSCCRRPGRGVGGR